jgi:hypothetical protein
MQEERIMRGLAKNWFPIALAILWVVMAAMAMVDFATFSATTQPRKAVTTQEKPLHSTLARTQVRHARGELHD